MLATSITTSLALIASKFVETLPSALGTRTALALECSVHRHVNILGGGTGTRSLPESALPRCGKENEKKMS